MRTTAALLVFPFTLAALTGQEPDENAAQIACAYAAKVTASAVFVSGRTLASVRAQELAPTRPLEAMLLPRLEIDVDQDQHLVTCSIGEAKATAVFRPLLGAVLVTDDVDIEELRAQQPAALDDEPAFGPMDALWPAGERVDTTATTGIEPRLVRDVLESAMAEPDGKAKVHTRAVVIVHKGRIVGERYAEGFGPQMPLPGWSMTKTLSNALLGLRAADGEFAPDSHPRVPYWRNPRDPRSRINYGHLLTMTSGLEWNEDYDDLHSDVVRMLFASTDHAAVFAKKRAAAAPGSRFEYSSGSTNLLCRVLRATFDDDESYWAHAQRLFRRLGMRTAVLEADPSGTFVGSSYGFMSARDWARLGLLYLQNGVFNGERVLPEDWVQQSTTASAASNGRYGWQIWLNAEPDGDGERHWPDLPEDLMVMQGHEGQYCAVCPSAEIVFMRLGCTKNGGFDFDGILRQLLALAQPK